MRVNLSIITLTLLFCLTIGLLNQSAEARDTDTESCAHCSNVTCCTSCCWNLPGDYKYKKKTFHLTMRCHCIEDTNKGDFYN